MKYDLIQVKSAKNPDPSMGGLSFTQDIPFEIKRMYWIYGVEQNICRGHHAHKRNWQILFCPYGKIDILLDDGKEKETVSLDSPEKALLLPPSLWHEMVWQQTDSVLYVAASELYDEQEYLRNYDQFLEYTGQANKE